MSRTVVVIGGGYGGASVAKALEEEADVVLVDPRDAFVNVAGSLRAVAQPDWAGNMFFPFDTMLTRATVIRDRAVSVDAEGVTLASGRRVAADYLVLATGSRYAYPAHPAADSVDEALNDFRRTHKELAGSDRVLILGAGPVGLELAGEIKEVWPDKQVTVVAPAEELLPGFQPEVRADLQRQLAELGVDVRLGTGLVAPPSNRPGETGTFTVTTTGGDRITADIWFRAFGTNVNSDYLADGKLTTRTPDGAVRVTDTLNVAGYDHVYAVGDITDVPEAKMAGYAMQHAEVVAKNITAQLRGGEPTETYQPLPFPMILLPLGSGGGVGQLPSPDGPSVVTADIVRQYKGADLFTGRFTEQFGPTAG
ncbi:NAD(P)/FAD-dependent oxidoreductase [Amycolatopsis thermoflava]|uniref:NADH dehydrogenase FAD-containing subunit n=1 Tax=Amycolatopsis thermoflava TaxID=84480 RepID=A0A3N2H5W1_9PSEU|nr:FAD-dependent oxidoreductase [Amycolatopsis thermoflava]ROS44302.1 NADH dehydrogenase FAD-containing subunit [Amycolatopsis thermoflava]